MSSIGIVITVSKPDTSCHAGSWCVDQVWGPFTSRTQHNAEWKRLTEAYPEAVLHSIPVFEPWSAVRMLHT